MARTTGGPPRLPPTVTSAVAEARPPGQARPPEQSPSAPPPSGQSGPTSPRPKVRGAAGPRRVASRERRGGGIMGRGTKEAPPGNSCARTPARPAAPQPHLPRYRPLASARPSGEGPAPITCPRSRQSLARPGPGGAGAKVRPAEAQSSPLGGLSLISPPLPAQAPPSYCHVTLVVVVVVVVVVDVVVARLDPRLDPRGVDAGSGPRLEL